MKNGKYYVMTQKYDHNTKQLVLAPSAEFDSAFMAELFQKAYNEYFKAFNAKAIIYEKHETASE